MNRISLGLILALVPLAPAAVAAPTTTVDSTKGSVSAPTGAVKQLLSCTNTFDKLLADLKSGMIITTVNSTLIDGQVALAESPKLPLQGTGFQAALSSATLAGDTIAVKSHIAAPGGNTSADMTATIEKSADKVRLRWTYKGKAHTSTVDACNSGYWTAADTSSAIAIKLAAPITPQVPR